MNRLFGLLLLALPGGVCTAFEGEALNVPLVRTAPSEVCDSLLTSLSAVYEMDSGYFVYAAAAVTDTHLSLRIAFPLRDSDLRTEEWVWSDSRKCYLPDPGSHPLEVTLFLTADPLADISFGDIWRWRPDRNPYFAEDGFDRAVSGENIGMDSTIFRPERFRPDTGKPAWKSRFYGEKIASRVRRYDPATPLGSLADVTAEVVYANGLCQITFKRLRYTGHPDDLAIELERPVFFQFAVRNAARTRYAPVFMLPAVDDADSLSAPEDETASDSALSSATFPEEDA